MSIITVRNLSLTRHETPVLHEVDFAVFPGETLVIIGPSGAGKSSLLRCLNRLEEPAANTIFFHERDILSLPVTDLRCKIGFVFQKSAIFEGTVGENIAYGPKVRGETCSPQRLRELMEMVALPVELMQKDAHALSGGQEQRMAIARALANMPEVLLLDEPTSSLDPVATRQIESTLRELRDRLGLTLVWVSHQVEQARRVATRVLLLDAGRVVRVDTVDAMLHPQDGDSRALAFADGEITGRT